MLLTGALMNRHCRMGRLLSLPTVALMLPAAALDRRQRAGGSNEKKWLKSGILSR